MNTIRSVGYGWGVLIVAGAGSYYFAKKQINADREQRALQDEKRRQQLSRMKAHETVSREMAMAKDTTAFKGKAATAGRMDGNSGEDGKLSPSREDGSDPAPVEHRNEVGRFEAKEPFRSRKGDRFS